MSELKIAPRDALVVSIDTETQDARPSRVFSLLRSRKAVAATAMALTTIAPLTAACSTEVQGAPVGVQAMQGAPTPITPKVEHCKQGGSPGIESTVPGVKSIFEINPVDEVAKMLHTTPDDIVECSGPVLDGFDFVTTAQYQKYSNGDLATLAVVKDRFSSSNPSSYFHRFMTQQDDGKVRLYQYSTPKGTYCGAAKQSESQGSILGVFPVQQDGKPYDFDIEVKQQQPERVSTTDLNTIANATRVLVEQTFTSAQP